MSLNYKNELPSLHSSEDQCWLNHPFECPLEFQSVMQIIMECMLRWDIKKQTSKGKGKLGTVVAFSAADEEQGRKTLYWH